ncbi:MAG TPA: FAD-dependent oxidoreductase [Pyrinomonadaceae bacterium]|jgi:glycine/D-amino acid oxidase-like deaminating enzyme|nr:FAD-dependent oxidoreductase [Pyrinomonadaceae bacterium]
MNKRETDRRSFLRGGLAAGALALAAPSLRAQAFIGLDARLATQPARSSLFAALLEHRELAPVKVSRERLIRTVVGLRPFRSEGFVVAAEKLREKLLVHNYGHGGAGVTLSWGTASMAVDLARDCLQTTKPTHRGRIGSRRLHQSFAVLGCGVSGLTTARLLQQRLADGAANVTIYAMKLPPDTTSNVAGAWWYPSSAFDPESATAKFNEQFATACRISHRAFQTLVEPEYGVRWTETYELIRHEASLQRELLGGGQLYPQTEIYRDAQSYFGFPYTRKFNSMLIEPHTYLRALLRDFYVAGGKVVVKEFHAREEIARLRENVIFNCTGLGARELFSDQKLIPVRGQLEVLLPQPEVDYCYIAGGSYMFPRRDGIVLGGTWDHDDWNLEPDPEITTNILAANAAIMRSGETK